MGRTERASRTNQGLLRRITVVQQQEGFGLVEVLVAVSIVATAVIMFLTTLSTGSRTVGLMYERTTAESLVRSQLEYTKSQDYIPAPASYDTIVPIPSGFTVSAQASPVTDRGDNIQKITVTVYRDGESTLFMEDFKVNR